MIETDLSLVVGPLYAGLRADDFLPIKNWEEIMTTPLTFPKHQDDDGSGGFDRRHLRNGAAAIAAATAVTMKAASAAK